MRLAQESYPLWRELEAESGTPLLELYGTLDIGIWSPNRDALAACGVAFELLDPDEIERRFPVRVESGEHALFQADGGIVYADLALEALLPRPARGRRAPRGRPGRLVEEHDDAVMVAGIRARVASSSRRELGAEALRRRCEPDARDGVVLQQVASRSRP